MLAETADFAQVCAGRVSAIARGLEARNALLTNPPIFEHGPDTIGLRHLERWQIHALWRDAG